MAITAPSTSKFLAINPKSASERRKGIRIVNKKSLTVRAATWSALHPKRAILGWFGFVVLCLVVGIMMGTNSATTEDYRVGEAGRAEAMASHAHLQHKPTEQVMIRADSGKLDQGSAQAAARDVSQRMQGLPEVDSVDPPVLSKDGSAMRVQVAMTGPELEGGEHVDALRKQTSQAQRSHPDLVIEQTGNASVDKGVEEQRGNDLRLSELITLPVTLVTLLLVFGSVLMAGVPVLLAVSTIAAAIGMSMIVSHIFPDAGVGMNLILLIGMAVGVDYTLFYLKREREERDRAEGRLSQEAMVEIAASTSGRSIVVSGLAVITATATLFLASDVIFTSITVSTILVVALAVVSSVTALPALLVTIGRHTERRRRRKFATSRAEVQPSPRRIGHNPRHGNLWDRLLRPARFHPRRTVLVATAIMLILAAPVLGMKLIDPGNDTHSRDIPAMQSYDRLNAAFPELLTRHDVVVKADQSQSDAVKGALDDVAKHAQKDSLFGKDTDVSVQTSHDGETTKLSLSVPHGSSSKAAVASLQHLRDDLPETVGKVPGAEYGVTGDVARSVDYVDHQNSKVPMVLGLLLLVTFMMTVLVFRSIPLAILGVFLNLLSTGASLGLLVVFFQGSWAEGLLGFNSLGAIAARVPLFLFVVLFGLSMDYQVFVISRIREAALSGKSTREAVLEGVGKSAKVVTSAAIVMFTVFTTFVFLHLTEIKQIGFSLAIGVLLDAIVVRVMILPSALILLDKFAWWPSRSVRRAQERENHDE